MYGRRMEKRQTGDHLLGNFRLGNAARFMANSICRNLEQVFPAPLRIDPRLPQSSPFAGPALRFSKIVR